MSVAISISDLGYEIPVLFLVFNRPDETNQVFEAIRRIKPLHLYIAGDGPREGLVDEAQKVEEVRSICSKVDWPCNLKTLFREKNLGCKVAVSSAIDWFFVNEEMGIILEDDVVPSHDFFGFMEYCLIKYKNDQRIMMVSGTSYLNRPNLNVNHFMTHICSIWGWGTWRRSWNLYDLEMRDWSNSTVKSNIRHKFGSNILWRYFSNMFDNFYEFNINTWDIQWAFACIVNNGLCIAPKVNLVSNVGIIGTHSTSITSSHFMPIYPMPYLHSSGEIAVTIPDAEYENYFIKNKILPIIRLNRIIMILKFFYFI